MPKSLRKHLISAACIFFSNSAVRVHVSKAYRKTEMIEERISLKTLFAKNAIDHQRLCLQSTLHCIFAGCMKRDMSCRAQLALLSLVWWTSKAVYLSLVWWTSRAVYLSLVWCTSRAVYLQRACFLISELWLITEQAIPLSTGRQEDVLIGLVE